MTEERTQQAIKEGVDTAFWDWIEHVHDITTQLCIVDGVKKAARGWLDDNTAVVENAIKEAVKEWLDQSRPAVSTDYEKDNQAEKGTNR